ncbi:nickel/cobalt transporter [Marinomonas epiphytica]
MFKKLLFTSFIGLLVASSVWASDSISYQSFIQWVLSQQAVLHRELVTLVRDLSREASPVVLWSLMTASFAYGVFHAAGPGHGKAVISAYMLASKAPIRQGVVLSFVCAMAQGIMAIALILVLSQVFSIAGKAMQISRFFEIASFAAVGAMGIWILSRLIRGKSSCGHDHSHDHSHSHDSAHVCGHRSHDHDHDHKKVIHTHEEHIKSETTVAQRSYWAMVLAVGIRPCTGAVLVLLFSISANIFQWGILATFAMSLGTAITVAALAILSVFVRDAGLNMSRARPQWQKKLTKGFGYAAACSLIFVSCSMIYSYIDNAGRAF